VIVVADASPLRYLILIEHTHVLPLLYGHVHVPSVVVTELTRQQSPAVVQEWIGHRPDWVRVLDPTRAIVPVEGLHPGELAAIALAEELAADVLLIDDRDGRRVAERRGVAVLGTLRVLADAAEHGFADLQTALGGLRQTNFRASEQLFRALLDRDLAQKRGL